MAAAPHCLNRARGSGAPAWEPEDGAAEDRVAMVNRATLSAIKTLGVLGDLRTQLCVSEEADLVPAVMELLSTLARKGCAVARVKELIKSLVKTAVDLSESQVQEINGLTDNSNVDNNNAYIKDAYDTAVYYAALFDTEAENLHWRHVQLYCDDILKRLMMRGNEFDGGLELAFPFMRFHDAEKASELRLRCQSVVHYLEYYSPLDPRPEVRRYLENKRDAAGSSRPSPPTI